MICRALLDTGAGSSYASAALLDKLPRRSQSKEVRQIEMMLGSTIREVSISTINVGATDGSFKMDVEVTRVERGNLLMIANPNYQTLVDSYGHLEGVSMEDNDTKPLLPVHFILGASAYAAIRTAEGSGEDQIWMDNDVSGKGIRPLKDAFDTDKPVRLRGLM